MGNAQRVINSGVQGVVAAMAMSGTRALTHSLGLVDQTPPEAVLHQQAPALMAKFPREKRLAVTELAGHHRSTGRLRPRQQPRPEHRAPARRRRPRAKRTDLLAYGLLLGLLAGFITDAIVTAGGA